MLHHVWRWRRIVWMRLLLLLRVTVIRWLLLASGLWWWRATRTRGHHARTLLWRTTLVWR